MGKLKIFVTLLLCCAIWHSAEAKKAVLKSDKVKVVVNEMGGLEELKNLATGHNYASGGYLWRLYFDTLNEREIEVIGGEHKPTIKADDKSVVLTYDDLKVRGERVAIKLQLTISLEGEDVHFASAIENNETNTIVRELEYPLIRKVAVPQGHKLITSNEGGRIYDNPVAKIAAYNRIPYRTPAQHFRQINLHYGGNASMNCYMLVGEEQGLYIGSHDSTFQDTWHGFRTYPDKTGKFSELELGLYKYPHCFAGEKWSNDTYVVSPYSGSWHKAADKYRAWAASWWDHRPVPQWVRTLKSWQRIIFKHQYGNYLYRYSDLYGRIQKAGEDAGAGGVIAFGWWKEGMDNGNPAYSPDEEQGGDKAWSEAIAKFKKSGQKLLMYYNGQLIDTRSEFYRSGEGSRVCYKDSSGTEIADQYRFSGMGTYLAGYEAVSFVIADTRYPIWREKLIEMADRAHRCGANSVFYDQLGKGFGQKMPWDTSREFPVPDNQLIYHKGQTLKVLRDHISKNYEPDFALGTEMLVDYTSQYTDYIHIVDIVQTKENFSELFRYTFPDVVFTDRNIRDDTDVERRVNLTLLKGLLNDIEIYRCRGLIDETPRYQAYLAKVNALRDRYADCLLLGTFRDELGFENSNKAVQAKAFFGKDRVAVVATNEYDKATIATSILVPGYRFVEASTLGNAKVKNEGKEVLLGEYDLAVLLFEKVK
ncbi:MAG: hypothetical protein IKV09_04645 [Alistipes sp.]|nr:hypothetical protein [Alistipes sp.]